MNLDLLKEKTLNCKKCPLYETRKHVVFGKGNPKSRIMLIGEGPGYHEDQTGIPFVGNAGKLLDKMLGAISLTMEDVYIANIVKCRPPQNRNPKREEEDACLPILREQVKCINPELLICLGSVAAKRIISEDFSVTKSHGIWIPRGNFWLMATYHPSALLRFPDKKREAWEDLQKIRDQYRKIAKK